MTRSSDLSIEDYIEEVYYCESCHSLCIISDPSLASDDWDGSYCGKCHSTHIGSCFFGDWLAEEERREEKRREQEWKR